MLDEVCKKISLPSPQFYAYKCEKLEKLENQYAEGLIDLYYGDESHVCTSGYVPYGWHDELSLRIKKKTVVILDNTKIHRAKKVICHRELWEKRKY